MLKLIGSLFFALGSAFFVYTYNDEEKEKIKKNENILRLIQLVNMNVLEKKMVLADAFFGTKGRISKYIDTFLEEYLKLKKDSEALNKYNQREIIIDFMKEYFIGCNSEILENAVNYITILGLVDKKTSLENFNLVLKDCENIILNIKEECKKNIKLTRTITYAIASVTILVLL